MSTSAAAAAASTSAAGSGNATADAAAAAAAAAAASKATLYFWNGSFSNYLYIICGSFGALLLIWTLVGAVNRKIRTIVCLNNDTQKYFARPGSFSWFKKHILYAPIFNKRHNREIQLSSAVNMGTMPTRVELFFLMGYVATNVIFVLHEIPWSGTYVAAMKALRNRSGILCVVNMVPLFVMAARNNPLIVLIGLSFDTFNLLHRWFGRIVVVQAVVHVCAHMAANSTDGDWSAALAAVWKVPFLTAGGVSTIAMMFILVQSYSPIRHAFYETFKILHILAAVASVVGLYYHLKLDELPQIKYTVAAIAVWGADRFLRISRIVYNNIGAGGTQTIIEALPENAIRVSVVLARPFTVKPGQHAYLYFPSISMLQSHPFSIAWSQQVSDGSADHIAMTKQDALSMTKTSIDFVIRARTGATLSLYQKAAAAPEGRLATKCFVEGPYGHLPSLASYGTAMIFAGGVGITQAVPHVRELVEGYAQNTVATRKIILVWIIPNQDLLEWIRPYMTTILEMEKRREVLRIMIFVTRPRSAKEVHSPSSTVQMFPGKPNIDTLVSMEMENQIGAMGVSVCGPGALGDEIRSVVRGRQMQGEIDFMEEAFTW